MMGFDSRMMLKNILLFHFCLLTEIKGIENVEEEEKPDSFNGLDYLLLGYNVLRGYPQAVGHDPGMIFLNIIVS